MRLNNAINKYGKENFTREIVQYFSNIKNAYSLEAAIVTQDLIKDPHCYNIAVGGHGGYVTAGYTKQQQQIFSDKLSKAHKGQVAWNKNKSWSEEVIQKLRKPKTDEHKRKLREAAKHRPPKSKESRQKFAAKIRGNKNPMYGKNAEDYMTPEAVKIKRKKQSEQMKNRCPINNGLVNKRVKQSDVELFLNNGWKLGYIKNKV